MKGKRGPLIGIILGTLFGWGLSNFLMPFNVVHFSFFLGFITCLVFVYLAVIVLFGWKRNQFWTRLRSKHPTENPHLFIEIVASFLIVLGGAVGSFLMIQQNEIFESQRQHQHKRLNQEAQLTAAIKNSSLGALMNNIFDKVDNELKDNPKRVLSDETIERIAALSYSFSPYATLEGDSLSDKKLSPERGQLLLALTKMDLDSNSFNKIKLKGHFEGADLKEADLYGANLKWAGLREVNLKGADLRKADLAEVDLWGAILWGAKLNAANLSGVDLRRADLRWADLSDADLRNADLQGVDLSSAKMSHVDLTGADLQWSDLSNAFFNDANLAGIKMSGTNLRRSNFSNADLSGTILKLTIFEEAILRGTNLSGANMSGTNLANSDLTEADLSDTKLSGANLTGANLDQTKVGEENWFEKLVEWKVKGVENIQGRYKIVADTAGETMYRLLPINMKQANH